METQKQVTTKTNGALPAELKGSWDDEKVDSKDILIPKLLLMQGLSQAVAEEKAQMGDFVDSITNEKLGSGREKEFQPVKIIPVWSHKQWVTYEKLDGGKVQFKGIFDWSPENANWERETETERRDLVINWYVLLADHLEKAPLPYVIPFRRTSFKAGQKLLTHKAKCQYEGVPYQATMFELTAKKVQNDEGTFYVYDVSPAGATTREGLVKAHDWFQTLKKGIGQVDNRDYENTTSTKTSDVSEEEREF